jgi:predicted house-cleaning noncanonical NTP pyrophosphatase (MazG superfamily)
VNIVDDNEFDVFMQTLTIADLKNIIKEYKQVKGISKYRKADLIEAFIDLLSEEEQISAYEKWMPKKIRENIEKSIIMLTKWRNTTFSIKEDANEYAVDIAWAGGEQDHCAVTVENGKVNHSCSCRLGERGGICVHLVALIDLLYLKEKIRIEQFPFTVKDTWLENVLSAKDEILIAIADTTDADIDMNEYWLFIRGDTITAKWSGDYAGTNTVDIAELNKSAKNKITVEEWVTEKVVDKQLENLRKYGNVREIIVDKFGVIEKIIKNIKQFKRLQAAFKRAAEKFGQENYPQSAEEIRNALKMGLIE